MPNIGGTLSRGTEFVRGAGYFLAGARCWRSHARVMAWAIVPALLAGVVIGTGILVAVASSPRVGSWAASGLDQGSVWHTLVTWIAGIAFVVATGIVSVMLFVSLTLIIGQPFYEKISRVLDPLPADAVAEEEAWWRTTGRGIVDAIRLLAWSLFIAVVAFAVSFVPVVGVVSAFVLSALTGGWLLALELSAYPSARRGVVTLRHRRELLKQHRWRAVGFGAVTYVTLLVPGAAIVVIPTASAGATKLVSDLTQPTSRIPATR
ncbi:EI24 domain-containing protein [Demequina sediminicola]|uniref:EI24 domain-containing protein n=1 Tax=Demequina sediminicola TaxID=1095026 RepID=UPI0009E2FF7B|nr:EI24 domain-containing protein [Demequina sediminicola]